MVRSREEYRRETSGCTVFMFSSGVRGNWYMADTNEVRDGMSRKVNIAESAGSHRYSAAFGEADRGDTSMENREIFCSMASGSISPLTTTACSWAYMSAMLNRSISVLSTAPESPIGIRSNRYVVASDETVTKPSREYPTPLSARNL